MKPWMWRMFEAASVVLAAMDCVLLPVCWLIAQFCFFVIARGIWRTGTEWHSVAGAVAFTLFATLLWGIVVFTEWRRSLAAVGGWRAASPATDDWLRRTL
ncbi:MAG: hypothetical protein HYZ07_02400 [Candidatus Harrisonbacteria bacterium]|nr:hypothetical protein [Candidatus Harrisonbacteria bacterium]